MKKRSISKGIYKSLSLGALLLFSISVHAQSGTAAKLNSFKSWLDPILDIIVAIALIVSFVGLIIALASKSQDVKSKATYFILALLLWAIKAVIFSDIAGI